MTSANRTLPTAPEGYTFIYALVDPRNRRVRYVGKTDNPKARLALHLVEATNPKFEHNRHKCNWLRSLLSDGFRPEIRILDCAPLEDWCAREIAWIALYREKGERLTNLTDGGEGGNPGEETRLKMSERQRGRKHSEETRRKMSESAKARGPRSEETRQKLSAAHKGRKPPPMTEEGKRRVREANSKPKPEHVRQHLLAAVNRRRAGAGITDPVRITATCSYCGKAFEKETKRIRRQATSLSYCCPEHCAAHRRENPHLVAPRESRKVEVACAFCGAAVLKYPSSLKKTKGDVYFCNREHRALHSRRSSPSKSE